MAEQGVRCYGCMKEKKQPVCEHCGWEDGRDNAPHQLPVGTVLRDQYIIGRALGQGGFGITYLGWDRYLDIPVAIKEYYPTGIVSREAAVSTVVCCYDGQISEQFQKNKERFMRESKTLARFSDMPEVVQVRNFFLCHNTAYIVMEYVQGITLKEYIRRMGGLLTMDRTLELLRPLIQTLDKLHGEGIVHRDISPDNIMMLPNGRIKLIDFGAVRDVSHADVDAPLSRSTEAILKQGFAPIEQYQNRGSLGPWTDVYALCATIYYCVTGHVLMDAPGRLLDGQELNLRESVAMTEAQEQALSHGLELLPTKRIRSMAELEQGLYPADSGGAVLLAGDQTLPLDAKIGTAQEDASAAVPVIPPVTDKPARAGTKKKKIAVAAVLAVLLLLIGVAVFWIFHPHSYGDWEEVRASSCTENGLRQRTCFCGHIEQEVTTSGEHSFVQISAIPATCQAEGQSAGVQCSKCGIFQEGQEPVTLPKLTHEIMTLAAVAPTCEKTGLTEGKCCKNCDYVEKAQETVPKLEHEIVTLAAVAPTCEKTGLSEGEVCKNCDYVKKEQQTVPATGHKKVTEPAIPASCSSEGMSERVYCSVCKTVFKERKVTEEKKPHDFQMNTCTMCQIPNWTAEIYLYDRGTHVEWDVVLHCLVDDTDKLYFDYYYPGIDSSSYLYPHSSGRIGLVGVRNGWKSGADRLGDATYHPELRANATGVNVVVVYSWEGKACVVAHKEISFGSGGNAATGAAPVVSPTLQRASAYSVSVVHPLQWYCCLPEPALPGFVDSKKHR